jgi:lipopolysaccharide/colanic/teichoic acid biosynthesis glycosyltransferase
MIERHPRVKRAFDVCAASLGLVLTAPLLAVAALGIKLSSRGPAFYRARRVGRRGRLFTMYKLRTMHEAKPGTAGSAITAHDDGRVFALGRLLRKAKIDELPQLVNVLRGDMAIVGPRPEDPGIVERHYRPHHFTTLMVRPGLTSPGTLYYFTVAESQVEAEQDYAKVILPLKLALDLVYVRSAGPWYDLALIARTVASIARALVGRSRAARLPEMRAARRQLDGRRGMAPSLRMEQA